MICKFKLSLLFQAPFQMGTSWLYISDKKVFLWHMNRLDTDQWSSISGDFVAKVHLAMSGYIIFSSLPSSEWSPGMPPDTLQRTR